MARFAAFLLILLTSLGVSAAPEDFPRPPELEPAVRFWTQVYTRVSTDGGLIHDRDNLGVVYDKIRFDDGLSRRERSRRVRERKDHFRELLREIAASSRDELSGEAARVLALWPEGVSDARLRRAAHNIRFQLGQSNKFRAGLVRSGAWEPHIRRTLKDMGLPEELAALPHVESSFNPDAWSRVGAAGLWQFTRSTGRRYMRIDHVIDERMDPFKATVAAARLLEHNHSVTDSWALALTAYNHGLAGIRRAVRQVGTKNIATIAERYRSRTWGFASRNFYPAFLAAVEVDFHASKYFGIVDRRDPVVSETIELPFYATPSALADAFDVSVSQLRELNRALRDPIWEGNKRVPRGYALRVPAGADRAPANELLSRVDADQRFFAQVRDRYHRVRRGEALSTIARRYDVSTHEIMALNNLRSRHLIRAGQTLRLPVPGEAAGSPSDGTYTVRRGDTLSSIASRVGMNVAGLATANGLDDRHRIYPGQELRVDGSAAETVQQASATSEPAGGTSDEPAEDTVVAAADTTDDASASDAPDAGLAGADGKAGPEAAADAAAGEPASRAETTGAETTEAEATEAEVTADHASPETPQRLALTGGISSGPPAAQADDPALTAGGTDPVTETRRREHDLAADPSDYAVADDRTIEVQAAETLGHYAEWLDLRASQLRRVNDMRYGTPVVIGKRIELDFTHARPETFEERRLAYHEKLQGRFFEQFRIAGTERELVQTGDSLWTLARRSDNVPVWLLRQYNPDLDFTELQPGMPVTLPVVERQPQSQDDAGGTRAEAGDERDAEA